MNWVSVKDELPKESGEYLICNIREHIEVIAYNAEEKEWDTPYVIEFWGTAPGLPDSKERIYTPGL